MKLGSVNIKSFGFSAAVIVMFVAFGIAAPNFATPGNVFSMLHAMAPLTIASCGIALVILTGKIDISIGSVSFLSASIAGLLMEQLHLPWGLAMPMIILSAALMGAINGFLIAILKIDSLIATLGTMIIFRGIALMLTNSRVIALPDDAQFLSNWSIGYFSLDTFIMIIALIVIHALHKSTRLGRYINAVGDNEEVAKKVGINTQKTIFITYILSGVFAGFSSLCSFIQVGSISGFLGKGLEFNAIAVAVVGGLSLAGGKGKIFPGIFIGAIAFQVISNGLNQISANPYIYQLVTGGIIFIAMLMDSNNSSGLIARFTVKKRA